jgi:uncharacterized lipoprotein YajG
LRKITASRLQRSSLVYEEGDFFVFREYKMAVCEWRDLGQTRLVHCVESRVLQYVGLFLCLVSFAILAGCAVNRESSSVTPNVDVTTLKKFYVAKFDPDQRGINQLISAELQRKGLEVSTGHEADVPKHVDAIVTYRDKWQWDITMYMIELTVYIREPGTQNMLATATSYHTSATRKTPDEMVAEVLNNVLSTTPKAPKDSGNMLVTLPPYESTLAAHAAVPARKAAIRIEPVRDVRRDATGSLIGERWALSRSMGKIEMTPIPVEMVSQVLRAELKRLGHASVDAGEDFTIGARLTRFEVLAPSTALYWDMNGAIEVELAVQTRDGRQQAVQYAVTCTDRTYANPSQALITKVVATCLGSLGTKVREDAVLAGLLAAR